jgi:hypothetical protein
MTQPKWWGDWRPQLDPHTGDLQPTDLIECTQIIGGQPVNTAITGQQIINASGGGTPTGYYLQYQDNITQPLGAVNVGQEVKFRSMDITNGISMVNDTQITFAHTGIYNLQFSFQFQNADTKEHDVTIWLRKNGTDVPGSAGFVAVVSSHGGIDGHNIVSWNYLLDVIGGDYYEFIWTATDTLVSMEYYPAGNPPPSTASAIVTVTQQAGIMAGTGMTALNGLSADVQTISTGTAGTDFNVISSGTDHQFNIPTASAVNRGALSTTDWSTFNSKQPTLVSGTNIKTINSTSLLGSGDIAVQPTLVSNTNIKTVNLTSLLGSGNIAVQSVLQSGTNIKTINSTSVLGSGNIAVQPTLVSGTNIKTVNGNTLLGSGDVTINGNPRTLAKITGSNLTGTTNQISASYMIPAGTLTAGNSIYIRNLLTKSAGSTSSTARIYLNLQNTLSAATLLATAGLMTSTTYIQRFERNFYYDGTNLYVYNPSNAISTDLTSGTLTLVPLTAAIDYYLIFAVQNSTTTPDDLGHKRVIIQLYD